MGRIRMSLWCVAAISATLLLWACGDEPGPTEAPSLILAPTLQEPGDEPPPDPDEPSATPDGCADEPACEISGGGGGGDGTDSPACNSTNPDCLQPLTPKKQQKVDSAIVRLVNDPTICAASRSKLSKIHSSGHIYKGNPLLEGPDHVAQYTFMVPPGGGDATSVIHVEQSFLTEATPTSLAAILAHEGFHALGYWHTERPSTPTRLGPSPSKTNALA